ncbi:ABC transporter substrate-binding protein [Sphingomonas sp. Leaf357]|uniref:arabinan endo-1,5-alpha-L-arabinosidase n=1 Tax=Sphingomonas sp. Leaf357 TaxID=1736350 RepID=UPI0006F5C83F|nr:arabinan endo-1,5-alpha-L-arabinosidase [Sphingomonas sp. Leaf357]KQS02432.1 ABC transporter substrate-binding protein [Sphingomonas sp. Leaf357]
MRRGIFSAIALTLATAAGAQQTPTLNSRLTGDLVPTHDPVIAREGDTYYVFGTGLSVRTSKDLVTWTGGKPLLDNTLPAWAEKAVPGAKGMWAPDISFVNGRWRLYYAVSTFGSNRSAIGLATSPTLDPAAPGYGWRDEGMVVASTPASDFNAIDANFVIDREGRHWLSLGSFWNGLKLFPLDAKTGKPADPTAKPYAIAERPAPRGAPAPVEAPFILDHGGYYWLFASYDYCCKGAASTYYTVVGRAKAITGPYLGKDGSSMMQGGGTIFLRADLPEKQRFRGPGHVGFLHDKDGKDYVAYHAYDRDNKGAPTLRIAPVTWGPDGWPKAED